MEKKKYIIQVNRVRGTVLAGKKGDVVELPANSDEVKSLEERGWITLVKEDTKKESELTEDVKEGPKKTTKTKK